MRQLLDQIGGAGVRVLPSTPALLHAPLREALATPEPQVRLHCVGVAGVVMMTEGHVQGGRSVAAAGQQRPLSL